MVLDYSIAHQKYYWLSSIAQDFRSKKGKNMNTAGLSYGEDERLVEGRIDDAKGRPRVLLLVDRPGWAYDTAARSLVKYLGDEFEFRILYVVNQPDLLQWDFDVLYVFFWGETYHQKFNIDPNKVIKEISSHRWENEDFYGRLTAARAFETYLSDARTLTATSERLRNIFSEFSDVLLVPNGFDDQQFYNASRRVGKVKIGWAGNLSDPCKGVYEILEPAAGDDFQIEVAPGNLDHAAMQEFYNSIDVFCVASTAEGEPLTLIEAMAAGCFPVCVDVGIVPELVIHRQNGLIIERSVAAFSAAFQWCTANPEAIRRAGQNNALLMRQNRSWPRVVGYWRKALLKGLQQAGCYQGLTLGETAQERSASKSAMAVAKDNYYEHFKKMNPAGAHDETYSASLFYYKAELTALLPPDKMASILDVGAGFGHLMRFFLDNGYSKVGGVEIDRRLFEDCKAYIGDRADFLVQGDAIPFLLESNSSFDFISAYDIIEHFTMEEAIRLSQAIHEALRPGGVAVFRTPNMANVLGIYSRYIDITHQTGFTEFSLSQLLFQAGFSHVELKLPNWDPMHPLTPKLKESEAFHRQLFSLQDRATPKCFEKNIVVLARK